jgi:hypothetical protein
LAKWRLSRAAQPAFSFLNSLTAAISGLSAQLA